MVLPSFYIALQQHRIYAIGALCDGASEYTMNFSKKLVPALLGLSLLADASTSWAAAPGALVASNTQAFADASSIALNSFQASGDTSIGSIDSLVAFGAAPVTFQQVEGSAPLAAGDFAALTSLSDGTNPQGNWRVLLAGMSLIGFTMVRRSARI